MDAIGAAIALLAKSFVKRLVESNIERNPGATAYPISMVRFDTLFTTSLSEERRPSAHVQGRMRGATRQSILYPGCEEDLSTKQ